MLKQILHVFIVLLTLVLNGCQSEHRGAMKTLRLDLQEGDLPSVHPHDVLIYLRGLSVAKMLYEGLTRIDELGQAQLAGAKSVEVSPDRLRYTFTLRDNTWSNGSAVTAYQYENAWKEALRPDSTCPRSELLYMLRNGKEARKGEIGIDQVGVRALDTKTLVIELANPSPYLLELLAQPICMPLMHPEKKEMSEFNGPFMVTKWERGNLMQLQPNPHFWNKKRVSIPQVEIYMVQDTNTAYSLFQEKKIDYIGVPLCNLTAEQIQHLDQSKQLRSHPIDRIFWIHLNTTHPALSSQAIRQALSMAIDRVAVTTHILIGGNPLSTPLPTTLLPLSNVPMIREGRTEANLRFEQGLKELGLTKETFPPLIITYSQQANRKQMAEYLQESWSSAFGIPVQLEAKDWNTLRNNLGKGLYDISFTYQAPYYRDPVELLDYFSTKNSCNYAQWTNQKYSEKIAVAKKEKEFQIRSAILGDAEQLLLEQMPIIPVCTDRLMFAHPPELSGFVFDCLGAVDFSYATLKTN